MNEVTWDRPRGEAQAHRLWILRSGRFWVDKEGFFRGEAAPAVDADLADAQEQLATQRAMGLSLPRPFLMDIRTARSVTREARALFTGKESAAMFAATALIVGSLLSRAIGNLFIGMSRPAMPTRLFTSEADALAWLRTFKLPE